MSEQVVDAVTQALHAVKDPVTGVPITANNALGPIQINQDTVSISIRFGYPIERVRDDLAALVRSALDQLELKERSLALELKHKIVTHSAQQGATAVKGVKNIIAVASGKGGVGKSTVAANLALALSQAGARVAMLDADIYGPSQPRMLGVSGKPEALENKMLVPMTAHAIKVMSIGFLIEEDTPMIWRGPMATQALQQLLRGVAWDHDGNDIDYMVIDLPPGTGDIHLTLSQKIPVVGAVIVTTPQDIALLDARKAYKMFEKVSVPVLGVVANMSTHICSNCGHEDAIFGTDGAQQMAAEFGLPMLGDIPLARSVRELADGGTPLVVADSDSEIAKKYQSIAMGIAGKLAIRKQDFRHKFPNIVVEQS